MRARYVVTLVVVMVMLLGVGVRSGWASIDPGSPDGDDPFTLNFDENGHGTISQNGGAFVTAPWSFEPNSASGLDVPVLIYWLPSSITLGDVLVEEPKPSTVVSDVLRLFHNTDTTDALHLGMYGMIYYSRDYSPHALADTGLPSLNMSSPYVHEVVSSGGIDTFTYGRGNVFNGISDVPEPATLIVWSLLGAMSWLGMRVWRGGQRISRRSWSPENRQAILEIVNRRSH